MATSLRRHFPSPAKTLPLAEESSETGSPSKDGKSSVFPALLSNPAMPLHTVANHRINRCIRSVADGRGPRYNLYPESSVSDTDGSPGKSGKKSYLTKATKWLPHHRPSQPLPIICCWVLLMCLVATYSLYSSTQMWNTNVSTTHKLSEQQPKPPDQIIKDTLVMYIFSPTDAEYERNMRYFVKHGISEGDPCHYIIVVQRLEGKAFLDLPLLPSNAGYEFHDNVCFDYGTIGWLMRSGKVDPSKYKYFIMMNSSTRGPFVPAYHRQTAWSRIFTDKLNDEVKLVGSTISCEGAPWGGDAESPWRQNPHVQSYVLATDQVGLQILQQDGQVFACFDNLHDTIYFAELGSSLAVLKAGYNIDSLMMRYQGVDWRDKANWKCNAGFSPYAENHYDGLSIEPLEAVFVKVKSYLLDLQWTGPSKAVKFDQWQTARDAGQTGEQVVSSNDWAVNADVYRLPKMLSLQAIGPSCFDGDFYLQKNRDLLEIPQDLLFAHFIYNGQFEGRTFRYLPNCKNDFERAVWRLTNNKMGLVNFSQ
ncbi:TPA: hypothetical protein ACH3X3_012154 [Trebouxia sp. C0006]